MKWITNAVKNPTIYNIKCFGNETKEQALEEHLLWRSQFIEGELQIPLIVK